MKPALTIGLLLLVVLALMICATNPRTTADLTPNQMQAMQAEIDGLKARVLHLEKITGQHEPHLLVVPDWSGKRK